MKIVAVFVMLASLVITAIVSATTRNKPDTNNLDDNEDSDIMNEEEEIKISKKQEIDAAGNLALEHLYPKIGSGANKICNYMDIWMSRNYSHDLWVPRMAEQQRILNEYKAWAETIEVKTVRDAYIHWLDFYQRELESGRNELLTHAQEKKMLEYTRKQEEKDKKNKQYKNLVSQNFPKPPKIN